jgi:hypothetical protein
VQQDEESSAPGHRPATSATRLAALIPGVLLCIAVAGVSAALETAERRLFAHPYVEALVLAILLGMAVRSFWKPPLRWQLIRLKADFLKLKEPVSIRSRTPVIRRTD